MAGAPDKPCTCNCNRHELLGAVIQALQNLEGQKTLLLKLKGMIAKK